MTLSPVKLFTSLYSNIHEQDPIEFWAIATSISFAVIIFALWVLNYPSLPTQLPLFYSLPWGEAQLGSKPQLLLLPSISLLICLVNLTIVWHLHRSLVTLRRTLLLAAAAVSLMMTLTLIGIVSIFI